MSNSSLTPKVIRLVDRDDHVVPLAPHPDESAWSLEGSPNASPSWGWYVSTGSTPAQQTPSLSRTTATPGPVR